ncbi:glycosyl hydrolase-related protein [Bacteroidota bacterium]
MKKISTSIFLILCILNALAYEVEKRTAEGFKQELKTKLQLMAIAENCIDGFSEKIQGGEYGYPCVRKDCKTAMISRTSDGKTGFEFYTGVVPEDYEKKMISFFFYSDVDLNVHGVYDLYINDQPAFAFISSNETILTEENPAGGELKYYLVERDRNKDGIGCLTMTIPTSMIKKGERARIRVMGRKHNNFGWFMIFMCDDAVNHLKKSTESEAWYDINYNQSSKTLSIEGSENLIGKEAKLFMLGKTHNIKFDRKNEAAFVSINTELRHGEIRLFNKTTEFFQLNIPENPDFNAAYIAGEFVIDITGEKKDKSLNIWIERRYSPQIMENFDRFKGTTFKNSKMYFLNSSHQDIAWMDSPEKCVIERDTMLLTPILEQASIRNTYSFDVEDVLMLKEYIGRHPDRKADIQRLLDEGKIACGASFIQPYEEMYAGEDLVRQFYLGKKWLKKNFNGYDAKAYWNLDVPGRTMQMPQIMKKSGTKYLIASRHEMGLFKWGSPDGSYIHFYSPGHYGDDIIELSGDFTRSSLLLAQKSAFWSQFYTADQAIPVMSCQDMLPAIDYSKLISSWNSMNEIKNTKGKSEKISVPEIELATGERFMDEMVSKAYGLTEIVGERPAVWLYIHGPSHQQALSYSRRAGMLLPAAEKFNTIDAILSNSLEYYPSETLNQAWENKIYPDHGWGGVHGDITDNLFKAKFKSASSTGEALLKSSLLSIASRVKTNTQNGLPIILFNSLSWERTSPVCVKANFKKGQALDVKISDLAGKRLKSQLSKVVNYDDGSIKSAEVCFIAEDVPSIGYKTFYINPAQKSQNQNSMIPETIQNHFYRISLENGGIKQIHDKELAVDILDTDKFLGGEVFTMKSVGYGAGEFSKIQQPSMTGFDKVSTHAPKWELVENGSVYIRFRLRQQILHAVVEQELTMYNDIKRIDIETDIKNWEGVLYREFRMALPIDMKDGQVSYEVPFGILDVGKGEIEGAAGERFSQICAEVHPRGIMDWIAVNNDKFGVTMSSSVAVADYIDPTDSPSENTILQPILFASRRSCHGLGPEYLQTGNHHFFNSITSHAPGKTISAQFGKEVNEPLFAVVNPQMYQSASLPEKMGFFSIDKNTAIISTIKKCEDDESIIIRVYDLSGEDSDIRISSFTDIESMIPTNIIEEENGSEKKVDGNQINLKLGHHAIETIKLK